MKALYCALLIILATTSATPGFLRDAEICSGMYGDKDFKVLEEARDMPFIVLSRPDKDLFALAKKLNTRVLTYVTLYQAPASGQYQHADIAEHSDWVRIQPDGKDGDAPNTKPGGPKWVTTCSNTVGYHDYAIKTARLAMELGADGLFIDNAVPDAVCEGPKFGRHSHIYPDKDNKYAYRRLIEDVRDEVKKYGQDRLLIVNPGQPQELFIGACDGQMLEDYICSNLWNNRWGEDKILKWQRIAGPMADRGTAVIALSYIGYTKNSHREDAFYCYAWARLCGFIWADWFTGKDTAADLYRVRIGPPVAPMQSHKGYYSREFKWGMVVATSRERGASFRISAKDHPRVLDQFAARHLKPGHSGDYEITLGKDQGRVYVY